MGADTKPMLDILMSIPIGTIIGWLVILVSFGGSCCYGAIRLYKAFERFKSVKDENEKLKTTVSEHDDSIVEIKNQLTVIIKKLESQDVTTMKKLRRELVKDGERYLVEGKMTIREWKSWMEMFDEYHDKFKQNSYVETLKNKIERAVTIIGQLDEHGFDV